MAKKQKTEGFSIRNAASIFTRSMLHRLSLGHNVKNIDFECDYPDEIIIEDYKKMFDRCDIATRVTCIYPEEAWATPPEVYESEDETETEFEKIWKDLLDNKFLFSYLLRADILSGIGQFGVLLMGIDDGKTLEEPVEGIDEITGETTRTNSYKLLYLRPFDETVVKVERKELDVTSPRYGLPKLYSIEFETDGGTESKKVHWTRVLHIADNRQSSDYLGTPRMQPVFNRLLDIKKILGGSAEMFWKGGFPGISFEPVDANSTLPTDPTALEAMEDAIKEYMNGLQRFITLQGVTAKQLQTQVADPSHNLEWQLKAIAISLGVPFRIFLGTEEAQLAGEQDIKSWNKRVTRRQNEYLTPAIIRPCIERLIAFGVLPEVDFTVEWPDLNAPSDQEKAQVALTVTDACQKYVSGNVDALIQPKDWWTIIMKLTPEEADAIEKNFGKPIEDELAERREENRPVQKQPNSDESKPKPKAKE